MQFVPGCCHCSTGITGSVTGCGGLGVVATVQFKQSGTVIYTFTSNSSGIYTGTVAAGTYDRVVTEGSGRFNVATTNGVVVTGSAQSFVDGLSVATGYHCCSNTCPLPLADTIDMTDSLAGGGNHPMTYQFISPTIGFAWQSAAYAGFVARLQASSGVFLYGPGGGQINTTLTASSCSPPIGLTYTATGGSGRTFTITNA